MAQNSNALRSQEDYITQVSEEIEGRVTKRLSKEFSRTENRILGALARLDDFLMNPLLQGHSGATPEASRNPLSTSEGTNEDDSQHDPHPEAGLFHGQMTRNSDPEDGHDTNSFREKTLRVKQPFIFLPRFTIPNNSNLIRYHSNKMRKRNFEQLWITFPDHLFIKETHLKDQSILHNSSGNKNSKNYSGVKYVAIHVR